uniref:Uncharacterized protein n=1 Tax=Tetranychus urticae TaxID=32264 RepID=T1K0L7_TETUR
MSCPVNPNKKEMNQPNERDEFKDGSKG